MSYAQLKYVTLKNGTTYRWNQDNDPVCGAVQLVDDRYIQVVMWDESGEHVRSFELGECREWEAWSHSSDLDVLVPRYHRDDKGQGGLLLRGRTPEDIRKAQNV